MSKREALLEFGVGLLEKRDLSYWLNCGTLLGIVMIHSDGVYFVPT